MRVMKWYKYRNLPENSKQIFVGVVLNKENDVFCYEAGEEKKYKSALRKQKKENQSA